MAPAWRAVVVHLVQVLVPVYDNHGQRFAAAEFERIRRELTDRYGGVTAYSRAPAQGVWEDEEGRIHQDDVIVVEVMVEELDRVWWSAYRRELAERFQQESFVVRAMSLDVL
jgi:hypothetical protein